MKANDNIARSILWTVIAQLPAHVFGILAGVFIARILGPEGKGEFALFGANENLLRTVFGLTITNSLVYFIATKKIPLDRLKGIILLLIAGTILLSSLTVLLWLNNSWWSYFFPDYKLSGGLLILFLATVLISQINTAFTAYFQGLKHFNIVNCVLLINSVFAVLLFAVAFVVDLQKWFNVDFFVVVYLSVIVLAMCTFHWLYYYFKLGDLKITFGFNLKQDFKLFFRFAGLNHLSKILLFLNHRIILWFIALYLDNWHVGIFSLALGLAQILNSFTVVLESFLSSAKKVNQIVIFSIYSRIQFTIVLAMCIIVTLVSPFFLPWLYGTAFKASVQVLNIVIVGILFSYQSGIFSSLFLAADKLKYNVVSSFLGIIVTIILAPILIEKYSIVGAAYCQLIAYLTVFLFQYSVVLNTSDADKNLFVMTKKDLLYLKDQFKFKKTSN